MKTCFVGKETNQAKCIIGVMGTEIPFNYLNADIQLLF